MFRVYDNETSDLYTDICWTIFIDKEGHIYQGIFNVDYITTFVNGKNKENCQISDSSFWEMKMINGKSQLIRITISEEDFEKFYKYLL